MPCCLGHWLQSFVLLKNGPPVPPASWAAPSGREGCSKAQGAAVAGAAPLLPLHLEGMRRITVLGPMANRTGALRSRGGLMTEAGRVPWFSDEAAPRTGWSADPLLVQSCCSAATMAGRPARWCRHTKPLRSVPRPMGWRLSCSLAQRSWGQVRASCGTSCCACLPAKAQTAGPACSV